jgi:hypothetical protein
MRNPVAETPDVISLYLWDLRAQVESQLRCLTKIHRTYEKLPLTGDVRRAYDTRQMLADLADVLTMNGSVRGVCEDAIAQVKALPD